MIVLLVVVGLLAWVGASLLFDAWLRHRQQRPDLAERLAPYQGGWVADEAQRWLREQRYPHTE
jgi:hypothetical protein